MTAIAIAEVTVEQARALERAFLSGLNDAQDAFEQINAAQAWRQLGFDTLADWWTQRVQPVMHALSMRPTQESAAAMVERVRADEASLPPAQRRTQKELAAMAGVDQKTVSNWSRSTSEENSSAVDLGGPQARSPKQDLAPTILDALAAAGRGGLDSKAIVATWSEERPSEKDLIRALDKLAKAGEVVVTARWGGGGKPRKWASAEAFADLAPEVLSTLAGYGARGTTAFQIAFRIEQPASEAFTECVLEVLREQLTAGVVSIVGESDGNPVWALTRLLTAKTPEPVAAPSTAPIGPGLTGSGSASPESEPVTASDEERARRQVERERQESLERDRDRIRMVISGWSTVRNVLLAQPDSDLAAEIVAGLGDTDRAALRQILDEIRKQEARA